MDFVRQKESGLARRVKRKKLAALPFGRSAVSGAVAWRGGDRVNIAPAPHPATKPRIGRQRRGIRYACQPALLHSAYRAASL